MSLPVIIWNFLENLTVTDQYGIPLSYMVSDKAGREVIRWNIHSYYTYGVQHWLEWACHE